MAEIDIFGTLNNATPEGVIAKAEQIKDATQNKKQSEINADYKKRIETLEENGGGTGGTTDYNVLDNKPQIGGVELLGNKTLEDLGIQPSGEYATKTEVENATPYIGENGHWFVGGEDTGIAAKGADGVSLGEIALVQETGTDTGSENKVMSQKAVSAKFSEVDNTTNLIGLLANTYIKKIVEKNYSQPGAINEFGQNISYGAHSTYCYKCVPGETFYVSHTSYSSYNTRLPITIYKVPKGYNPTRDYLISENLMEIVATADNYNPKNKQVVIGDYLDIENYELYLCIIYFDNLQGSTDILSVEKATPQGGFFPEQKKKNEEQDELNKEFEKIPLIDVKINGGYSYVKTDFDGNIAGKITTEGDNILYANHFSYYKKVNSGERIKYSHTSTTSNILTYGFYQLPIGEKPARENIISANLLEPYSTSNATLIDEEITAPSLEDKDLYFLATMRIPGQEGGDTYLLSIYQEVQGYDERIENLEKNQGIRKPFEGKGVYFAGDSNTMYFLYKNKFLETTGMKLIGYTAERGNGATSTALYNIVKALDEEDTIEWAKIDIFGIFVGGNDYDHNIQPGTFESSYDLESPNTRYAAIRMLIEYCRQKAMDVGNNTMLIVAFSRPERDDYLNNSVSKTTKLLENVEYILYTGQPRNAVSEDFPDLTGVAIAQYNSGGIFEKSLLSPQKGEEKDYTSERVNVEDGKKIRISARTGAFNPNIEVHYIGGTSETITKDSTDKFETTFQWLLSDGTEVQTNNYYRGRRNGVGCTMADIGSQILDCARRMGCPACDIHSLCGVTYKNLRYWIPDGTHYGQALGDRLGVLMGNFINNLQL